MTNVFPHKLCRYIFIHRGNRPFHNGGFFSAFCPASATWNILMMFSATRSYVTCDSAHENTLMDPIVKLGVTPGGNPSTGTYEKGEGHHQIPAPTSPSPPCHHPRIRGATGRTGCDLYVCFWRGVLINSHERGPSIQPASRDALHWASLLFSPVHKTLSIEKKKGVDSLDVCRPKWCH